MIERLQRRASHLRDRIAKAPDRELSYDKSELSALEWVIRHLTAHAPTPDEETRGNQ